MVKDYIIESDKEVSKGCILRVIGKDAVDGRDLEEWTDLGIQVLVSSMCYSLSLF